MSDLDLQNQLKKHLNDSTAASYLISGGQVLIRLNAALDFAALILGIKKATVANSTDFSLICDDYGIETIRKITHALILKPYGHSKKVVVVKEAQNLTLPAQNAFLKILEEPYPNSVIILTAENTKQLLPTVISRCQLIFLSTQKSGLAEEKSYSNETIATFKAFLFGSLVERLDSVNRKLKDIEKLSEFLEIWIEILRDNLIENIDRVKPDDFKKARASIQEIKRAQSLLQANVNSRLVWDFLALNLPAMNCHF